ncbi:MAG: SRPBCC family protein [Solirubrobacterales bacterium]
MAVMQETETVVVERLINASPETLFEMWTDSEKISTWLAKDAELDPKPGGIAKLIMGGNAHKENPVTSGGEFLVVEPHTHLELTWGFSEEEIGVPIGSTVVAVDFIPQEQGTLVRVSHSGLPAGRDDSKYSERKGWALMLAHLEDAVA